jgi:GNAT superfamily N-acetyltransferase
MQVDEQQATSRVDLAKLSLVRFVEKDEDRDPEDIEACPDPELGYDQEWLRDARYDIVAEGGIVVGKLRIFHIDKARIEENFYLFMDEHSSELQTFAYTCYDEDGEFKAHKFSRDGAGVWGDEADGDRICYLESIQIRKPYRGQGIGSWALEKMWTVKEKLSHGGCLENIDFLFTMPALTAEIAHDLRTEHVDDEQEADRLFKQAHDHYVDTRVLPFLRKAGFRRVGTTRFFACARAASHPSKSVPIDRDANEFTPVRPEHEEELEAQSLLNFFATMRQGGAPAEALARIIPPELQQAFMR